MNREDMLAKLIAQAATEGGELITLRAIVEEASEIGATRVLDRLGLANAFDGMHDIHAMAYVPKPDPSGYAAICARYGIDPARALFADDMARNLKPAHAIGITTLWIDNGSEQGADPDRSFIDFSTSDLTRWLHDILEAA